MAGPSTSGEASFEALERAELRAVLASGVFLRSPTLSRFLTYVCQKYFEGNRDYISEHSIGVEALGRRPDFDPISDSIVRVEASRLRKRLAQYYETEGASHRIKLQLRLGVYLPAFVRAEDLPGSGPAAKAAVQPTGFRLGARRRVVTASAAAVVLVVCLAVAGALVHGFRTPVGPVPPKEVPAATSGGPSDLPGDQVRILAGYSGPDYVDSMGRAWSSDRFVNYGRIVKMPNHRIFGTHDQSLYRMAREGSFAYRIPLKPGVYELHLHFVEAWDEDDMESDGEGKRQFIVAINGRPLLTDFDIVKDAGGANIADEKVFTDVSPGRDGVLQLNFATSGNTSALVSGIEVLPGVPGKMLPVRILCGNGRHVDRKGQSWAEDRYFHGGVSAKRSTRADVDIDAGLYAGARWGRFSYSIPVAPGTYRATLKFMESPTGSMGRGQGNRVFNVLHNSEFLLSNFDILKEAGAENRPLDRTFTGLRPDDFGKLTFSFVPVKNYACLTAIEVLPEGP